MRILIRELASKNNEQVMISGFVDSLRNLQYVIFMVVRDRTGKVQVTIEKNEDNKELVSLLEPLTNESTVKVFGKLVLNEKVKLNGMEIIPTNIEITSVSKEVLPIDLKNKEGSLRETRLDYRFLDLRREENLLLFKIETTIKNAMREYWAKHEFIEITTPKISGKSAESGAEVFSIDYFGETAVLSQSPQFYKQMAMAAGFEKICEIGPAFRAENSHTSYHATEINMVDMEISNIDSVDEVMELEEDWLKYIFKRVKETHQEEITRLFKTEIFDFNVNIPRITLEEAKIIIKDKYNYVGESKFDLERKEEELICKYALEKYNSELVFVTKYPFEARPFYHMLDEEGYTMSFDLLYKGLEITTGAKREHRPEILEQQIIEKGIDPRTLDFYIDFFRYGCPPHGGLGFGVARLLMLMLDIDNIREATFIYRGPTRLKP
jgi:nondiscriminating aspartyl-tRNA synthetase